MIRVNYLKVIKIDNTATEGLVQKVVYSNAKNRIDELIEIKKCSEPSNKLKEIYTSLKIKNHPFTKTSVVHKLEIKNHQNATNTGSSG